MDCPRKRRLCNGHSATATKVTKKSRPGVDIKTLSNKQQAIIAQAASILQVPLVDVPVTIGRLQRSLEPLVEPLVGASRKPRQQSKRRKPRHQLDKSRSPDLSRNSPPPRDKMENLPADNDPFVHDATPESTLCGTHSCFGFEVKSRQFEECLASFAPFEQNSTHETGYNCSSFSTSATYYDTTPAFNEIVSSAHISFPHNGLVLDNYAQTVDTTKDDPPHDFFACDDPSSIPQWLPDYPVLQPTQIQMIQPLTNKQEMIYSRVDSTPGHALWCQNTNFNIGNVEDLDPAQLHVTENSESYEEIDSESDDVQGPKSATSIEKPGPSRRGPFRNSYDREQTAQTRKLIACLRCRMQRIRCILDPLDPRGVCLTCKNVSNMKISKLPCLRYKITDIRLFKPGQVPGMEWTCRWSSTMLDDISTWASTDTKTIQITEGYSSIPLTLEVGEFVPLEGDMLHRHWVAGGVKKSALIPPYAIVDLATAQQAYMEYINRGGAEFFKGALDYKDRLVWETYSTAIEAANNHETTEQERKLLKMVLRLWVAIRITTRSIRITGNETLGMASDILDETSPLHGNIPIPPVMGAQIELILIQAIQVPLRTLVLDLLQKLILANKSSAWFTIYLCIFILLHNCALITKHDAGYARKHGIKARFARPAMVAEYHMGANTLLAYFHYCNKGLQPFTLDGDASELVTMAKLNPKQIRFVQNTRSYVKAHESRFEEVRWQGAYENHYYFLAQLYEEGWKPRSTV